MVESIFNLINTSITSCSSWFYEIFDKSNMLDVFLAILFVVFVFKFLLQPVLGRSRGSDRSDPKRSKEVSTDE